MLVRGKRGLVSSSTDGFVRLGMICRIFPGHHSHYNDYYFMNVHDILGPERSGFVGFQSLKEIVFLD